MSAIARLAAVFMPHRKGPGSTGAVARCCPGKCQNTLHFAPLTRGDILGFFTVARSVFFNRLNVFLTFIWPVFCEGDKESRRRAMRSMHLMNPIWVGVLVLTLGHAQSANAVPISYAYARQFITDINLTAAGAVSFVASSTATGATAEGSPIAGDSDSVDALQAYSGPGVGPSENFFNQFGQVNADYARGDALIERPTDIDNPDPDNSAAMSLIAESYLASPITGASGADSGFARATSFLAANFSLAQSVTSLTLSLASSYTLSGILADAGADSGAEAILSMEILLLDQAGTTIFRQLPADLNDAVFMTSDGSVTIQDADVLGFELGPLGAGTYNLTISSQVDVATRLSPIGGGAIPEPTTLGLMTIGLACFGYSRRKVR